MSAANAVDRIVTHQFPTDDILDDDPLTRLFIDQTLPSGMRLLAIAEPVHRTPHGFLTAATALIAFEEAFAVAAQADVEIGLERAFASANAAVRASNRATTVNQRGFAGITAVVINGCNAIVGIVPPGQVLIIQDERLYGVPDLASWAPAYVPPQEASSSDPLGLNQQVCPQVRRTKLAGGDQFVLGSSAVGRVLSSGAVSEIADLPNTVVIDRLEAALESSGIEGAYAAWIRVDAEPMALPISTERMTEIERIWGGEQEQAAKSAVPEQNPVEPRGATPTLGFHDRMIAASERLLARREPETLPLEATRRVQTPLGAGSLHRYTAPGPLLFGPSLRCRLPRGPRIPLTKRSFFALFVVSAMLISTLLGYNVRQARADKQDDYLKNAESALQLAESSESPAEALEHLNVARGALNSAQANGADDETIATLRDQAARAEDRFAGINRMSTIVNLGTLPGTISEHARLMLAGSQLYLVDAQVYLVDGDNRQLMPVLTKGQKIDRIKVGDIVSATVDGETLIVTDGKSLFFRDNRGRWSAEKLATSWADGWTGVAYGAFQGSFYVLDRTAAPTIRKFSAKHLDDAPVDWLQSGESIKALGNAIDMVVDSSIHVLGSDGVLYTLHKGELKDDYSTKRLSKRSTFVGVDGGTSGSYLFVLESYGDDARLLRYERGESDAIAYLPPDSDHLGYDAAAADALASATDFVVDETAGKIYVVTDKGLWQASLN
jgi:hypothetical protein